MQIRTKLTLNYVLITASLLLIAFVLIFFLYKDTRSSKFSQSIKNRALTAVFRYEKLKSKNSFLLHIIDKSNKDVYDFENISIYKANGLRIYSSSKYQIVNTKYYIDNLKNKNENYLEENEFVIWSLKQKINGENYFVIAKARDSYGLRNYENLKKILFFVFILIVSLLTLTGWIFTKRIMKPISEIMNQVDDISPTNLNLRLETLNNKDELNRLVNTFNQMLERIDNAFKIQKNFTSNAAHELKNPLTIITSQLEVTLLKERTNLEYRNICESILDDVKHLNEVSHQMFLLTKLSDKNVEQEFKKTRVDELLWDTRTEFLKQNPEAKIEIDLKNLPLDDNSLYFLLNETLIKTCFWNLIENGIKFSSNKSIFISLHFENNRLKIRFLNDGQQIQKSDVDFIFEPFFRSKNALQIKGFGIGLSIIKQITEIHKIDISLVPRDDFKTQFDLVFP